MSADIQARTSVLMSQHKEQLARSVAIFELLSGHSAEEAESALAGLEVVEEEHAMEQGTDPEITDVPPASTEPEVLEPLPAQLPEAMNVEASSPLGGLTIEGSDAAAADTSEQAQ